LEKRWGNEEERKEEGIKKLKKHPLGGGGHQIFKREKIKDLNSAKSCSLHTGKDVCV